MSEEKDLVRVLYKSRRRTKDGIVYRGDVADVVRELVETAEEKGLTVSRWDTASTSNSFVRFITWAAHEGERPERAGLLADHYPKIYLSGVEGTTVKCQAYKKLRELVNKVRGWERQLEMTL